jgi:hypothetical protein
MRGYSSQVQQLTRPNDGRTTGERLRLSVGNRTEPVCQSLGVKGASVRPPGALFLKNGLTVPSTQPSQTFAPWVWSPT